MAPIRRADRCYWIDVTEVTEGQYAAYLAANPSPIDDALCSGTPNVDSQCAGRVSTDGGAANLLPKTCVDWCEASAFCKWAGKALCSDSFTAIWPEVLNQSDFVYACTERGTKSMPNAPNCGADACNVDGSGPNDAGTITDCWVATDNAPKVYDLMGNVEEWTESCRSTSDPNAECIVRGGSFARFEELQCCTQKTQLFRRRRTPTLGFRCCAYP
jgi:sulfatase modifying factor 1